MEYIKGAESAKRGKNAHIRSAVGKHIIEQRYHLTLNNAESIKEINDAKKKITSYDSIYISKIPPEREKTLKKGQLVLENTVLVFFHQILSQ